ncbi:CstA-like transporter-associated (seleno)protein [Calditerricola satsumensis]|uniref:YbdD/YjiX family protein n=1 Tax=Calditerricola satsumensis TaxID=373054 RepID=A0A8J3BA72_9BACI|nr:YbdD/YjiX family protein [Calditerricola satsumensis]GGK04308.1 hypothetical protein GCM10007043_17960 [Calditerricola satsumensis]
MTERVRHTLRRLQKNIKTIFGMPDYERYLAHWEQHHKHEGGRPMTEAEYYRYYLSQRYEKGGVTRCC